MLVELFDLQSGTDGDFHWKECSRWYKYEESVEGVDNHRGRPHVSFLSFEALTQMKDMIQNGRLILDPSVYNAEQIYSVIKTCFSIDDGAESATANQIINILSAPKFRCHETRPFHHGHAVRKLSNALPIVRRFSDNQPRLPVVDANANSPGEHVEDRAECAQVFTGAVEHVIRPTFVMVRLPYGMYFPEMVEQIMHVRFLFIVLGPISYHVDYMQIGRCIATLMSNQNFHEIALTVDSCQTLSKGVDAFLSSSFLIPPGDIDDNELFSVKKLKCAAIRRRKISSTVTSAHVAEVVDTKNAAVTLQKKFSLDDNSNTTLPSINAQKGDLKIKRTVCDPFVRTGKPFGGVINDLKNRFPYYWDDYKCALNFQCVTSVLFIFFTNFANAVAIGEVLGEKTNGWMGVSEILISHALCGLVWGLVAGQPLSIMAAVGPFLVFEESLFKFCDSADVNFLATRFWTGLWTFLFMVILAMVEAPFLMRYLTRFTEDIFTGLIAVIFLWTAGKFVYFEFEEHPLQNLTSYCLTFDKTIHLKNKYAALYNGSDYGNYTDFFNKTRLFDANETRERKQLDKVTNQPDTALLQFMLFLATFLLAFFLKKLRMSIYCGRTVRRALGDFGVPLAIVIVTFFDQIVFGDIYTRHISMKAVFDLTSPEKRNWLVAPLGTENDPFPTWMIPASVLPAILVTILLYAEVEIIAALLAKKERHLQKPSGFHWDLILCGALAFVCSVFGLQWMCPAAVQSLAHANSLSIMKKTAPGEAPVIDRVLEQRVTTIIIALLHGAAAFLGSILSLIPTSALFGLFFYLGVMGLLGIQFWTRIVLFFVPEKYFPDEPYCLDLTVKRMHLYTALQLVCFAFLWTVNMFPISALSFPFVLMLIAVFRKFAIPKIFTDKELIALEGVTQMPNAKEKDTEPTDKDFYDQLSISSTKKG